MFQGPNVHNCFFIYLFLFIDFFQGCTIKSIFTCHCRLSALTVQSNVWEHGKEALWWPSGEMSLRPNLSMYIYKYNQLLLLQNINNAVDVTWPGIMPFLYKRAFPNITCLLDNIFEHSKFLQTLPFANAFDLTLTSVVTFISCKV